MTPPRWIEPEALPAGIPSLHDDPLLHELLARRGIATRSDAAAYLDQRPRHAPDATSLPNLTAAVDRIGHAIERGERIGIFGDYDADGVTATALLTRALRAASSSLERVIPRLPTRDEGYGLSRDAIDEFHNAGVSLLVAVDCGSSDHDAIRHARTLGLDVIVLDHHQIQGEPPAGAVVVSAQLPGGEALADLSAVGVAYVVVAALAREGHAIDGADGDPETGLLDFVALGTIADMVPLDGINRPLVRDGIRELRKGKRRGIVELCRKAGVVPAALSADQIVFKLGPRLNAAGRMGDPKLALDLLLEDDPLRAAGLASQLEQVNDQRRAESLRVHREAEGLVNAHPEWLEHPVLIVTRPGWPSGLLGPVAAQLVEKFGRPVVVLSERNGQSHGSARSVPGFDITGAMERCRDLLARFGGHGQAGGLTLATASVPEFSRAMDAALSETGIDVPFQPELRIDADLPANRLTLATAELLDLLQPFGSGNEQPLVRVRGIGVRQWDAIGADKSHLRLQLALPGGLVKAIAFGMAARSKELLFARRIDIAALVKIDQWNGQRRLDVEVKDFRPTDD
ncbi:MAG: single-stranded-DNA-specific exonuclease RecJ [Thermomicrobiales bacterium]|nr:single-stranded-DNA-specific exonuclease RecJ [Thermomicrobiales bacterium]